MIDEMRVLEIFMILGFLSSVIAQEETDNIGLPSNRSSIFELSTGNIEELRKECEKNGGPTAYNNLLEGWQTQSTCMQSLVNVTELRADGAVVLLGGKWDKIVKKYCHKIPNFVQCVRQATGSTKPCLDAEDEELMESYHNITSSYLEFMCQNDGSRVASFLNNGGKECLGSKVETILRDCPLEIPANTTSAEFIGQAVWWLELFRTDCAVFERFGTCTVGVLRTCDNPTPANVIESVFNFFKSRKSCPSISPTQPSPAT